MAEMDPQPYDLIESLWQPGLNKKTLFNGSPARNLSHEAYCEYYNLQCGLLTGYGSGNHTATRTADELHQLIGRLQANETRREIVAHLQKLGADRRRSGGSAPMAVSDDCCDNTINLAARLLLMLKFGVVKGQAIPRGVLDWRDGTLRDFLRESFDQKPVLSCEGIRLPKAFDGWSIEAVAGIKIDFTDNLADHLLLVEDDSRVLIFHHASFLECQQDSLFPNGLVDETLRTLSLLFPQSDYTKPPTRWRASRTRTNKSKRNWLRAASRGGEPHAPHQTVDPRLALCGTLYAEDRQIERFRFWRDRLVILKQAYDDATPATLSQWWLDRRDGVQWYTFWVAVVVLVITTLLGVVQCVEGALQVYKAYSP